MLSESWSPAPGPCGMPFFVEPAADELAGAGAELEDCVVGLAAGVDELEALDPHAATPNAARTKRLAAKRRIVLDMVVVIFAPSWFDRKLPIPMRRR